MIHHHVQIPELLKNLKTDLYGLAETEAAHRLIESGPNELQEKRKTPAWLLFLGQFKDFMILILIAAAVLSGIMGDMTDTIIIFIIVLLNAILGFVQEFRAGKAIEALKKMAVTHAHVLRDHQLAVISSTDLVPGDVVILEAGNIVPADIRLMEAHHFRVDEASLTGESVPVDKSVADLSDPDLQIGDRYNMLFKGTLVTSGRAKGLVVATGMKTELGRIAGMLEGKDTATPLQQRMARFGRNLSYIILGICLILLLSGIMRGEDPLKILLLALSLAVAAIPEALPALITIALSRGAARLARQNALIRKLPAVETLGSVNFICSDKTGTLTQNRMQVVEMHESAKQIPGCPISPLHLAMALNHDVQFSADNLPVGEPTETALVEKILNLHGQNGLNDWIAQFPRVAELPFDSDRKCMTTVHHFQGKFIVLTKGAAETIASILEDKIAGEAMLQQTALLAQNGIRVLAFAWQIKESLPNPFTYETVERNLFAGGLAGLMDPARAEVKPAIEECKTAGIRPVMITGDHPATATAIARQIGLLDDEGVVMTGAELQQLDDDSFFQQIESIVVYARVSPEQKLRIVKTLQRKGHFAAMTGDGVNDAPSLKAANIGVAMGITGTDVSKEAADLILLDDNFATIVKAVKEGRRIFDNIRKFVKYILTCNAAEIWTIAMAPLFGMPIPLLPVHILWINLVTDGLPALALGSEKAENNIMQRPPRPTGESLFADGVGIHIIWVSVLMASITLATQAWSLHHQLEHWQTMVFTVLAMSQLGHVLAVRSDQTFLYKQGFISNLPLIGSVFLTFLLQMAVVYVPFMNGIFKTQPLTLNELLISIAMSMVVFHAVELEKWVRRRRRRH